MHPYLLSLCEEYVQLVMNRTPKGGGLSLARQTLLPPRRAAA